jgi:hypothetical protein
MKIIVPVLERIGPPVIENSYSMPEEYLNAYSIPHHVSSMEVKGGVK